MNNNSRKNNKFKGMIIKETLTGDTVLDSLTIKRLRYGK